MYEILDGDAGPLGVNQQIVAGGQTLDAFVEPGHESAAFILAAGLQGDSLHNGQQILGAVIDFERSSRSRSSACLRSVMSVMTPKERTERPNASRAMRPAN